MYLKDGECCLPIRNNSILFRGLVGSMFLSCLQASVSEARLSCSIIALCVYHPETSQHHVYHRCVLTGRKHTTFLKIYSLWSAVCYRAVGLHLWSSISCFHSARTCSLVQVLLLPLRHQILGWLSSSFRFYDGEGVLSSESGGGANCFVLMRCNSYTGGLTRDLYGRSHRMTQLRGSLGFACFHWEWVHAVELFAFFLSHLGPLYPL